MADELGITQTDGLINSGSESTDHATESNSSSQNEKPKKQKKKSTEERTAEPVDNL